MGGRKKAANKSATPLSGARGRTQPRGSPAGTRQSANNPPTPPQDADGFIRALTGAPHVRTDRGESTPTPQGETKAPAQPNHYSTLASTGDSRSVEQPAARISDLPPTPVLLDNADALDRNKKVHVSEAMADLRRQSNADARSQRSHGTSASALVRMEEHLSTAIGNLDEIIKSADPGNVLIPHLRAEREKHLNEIVTVRARIAAREAPDERGVPQTVAVKATGDADDMSAIKSPDDAQRPPPSSVPEATPSAVPPEARNLEPPPSAVDQARGMETGSGPRLESARRPSYKSALEGQPGSRSPNAAAPTQVATLNSTSPVQPTAAARDAALHSAHTAPIAARNLEPPPVESGSEIRVQGSPRQTSSGGNTLASLNTRRLREGRAFDSSVPLFRPSHRRTPRDATPTPTRLPVPPDPQHASSDQSVLRGSRSSPTRLTTGPVTPSAFASSPAGGGHVRFAPDVPPSDTTFNNVHSLDDADLATQVNEFQTGDPYHDKYMYYTQGQLHGYPSDFRDLGFTAEASVFVASTFKSLMATWAANYKQPGPQLRNLQDLKKMDDYDTYKLDDGVLATDAQHATYPELCRWYSRIQPLLLNNNVGLMHLEAVRIRDEWVGFCVPLVGWNMYKDMTMALYDFLGPLLPPLFMASWGTMAKLKRDGFKLLHALFTRVAPGWCARVILRPPDPADYSGGRAIVEYAQAFDYFCIMADKTGEPVTAVNRSIQFLQSMTDPEVCAQRGQYMAALRNYASSGVALPDDHRPAGIAADVSLVLSHSMSSLGTDGGIPRRKVNKTSIDLPAPTADALEHLTEAASVATVALQSATSTLQGLLPPSGGTPGPVDRVQVFTAQVRRSRPGGSGDNVVCPGCGTANCTGYRQKADVKDCPWIKKGINAMLYIKQNPQTAREAGEKWLQGSKEVIERRAAAAVKYCSLNGWDCDNEQDLEQALASLPDESDGTSRQL
ncbi:hypothetical protein THAOC_35051 [Thalassiosira oceanica]|uniref:Uncharacterized protein n=1 Tax=Thalassiosira oceanica TaxID=159749 RepID=K0RB55_THAOC|nr:hypothetical protein THAOC_35051 [Thalassiosira oceanica]|eukprot:EJK46286.1 hypothetical protein THAOC_35051 [Thalassiosira oceanica]